MNCPRIAVVGAVFALGLGLFAGAFAAWPESGAAMTPAVASELDRTLSELSMSVAQRREVTVILADAADDLERLEEAMTLIGQRLRAAELERPFDARFVNSLVARQAELMAYRRGTESRTVAEIAALLSPEQHARFTDLRIPPKDGHRGHLDPRKQPPERAAPRSRSDAGLDEGRSMRPDVYRQRRSVGGRVPKRPRVPPSAAQLANAS